MKISRKMTIGEFAAVIASYLRSKSISAILTGGAVVPIYTENKYYQFLGIYIPQGCPNSRGG